MGLLVGVAYLVGGFVAYWHAWGNPTGMAIGGGAGDQAQTMWYLAWLPWAIGHGHDPFFTTVANYPFGVNLLTETSVMALALVVSPITVLWGPVAAFNVCLTASFACSAGAGYLLARRFVSWRPAAFAAGLLYGYSPYLVGQGVGHLNLVFVALPPLIFLALHELLVTQARPPLRWGLALGALVVVQFFVSTEVLASTAVFALAAAVVAAVAAPRAVGPHLRRAAPGIAAAAGVAVVVLAYPVWLVLAGPQHISGAIIGFAFYYSALLAPLLPSPLMHFGTAHMKALGGQIGGNFVENGTYLGAPLLLVGALGALVVRRRWVRVAAVSAIVAFVLSLGDRFHVGLPSLASTANVPLPGAVIGHLPLLDQAFPVRYSLYVALFVSLVLAGTLERLHAWATRRWPLRRGPGLALPAVVGLFALLPLVPAWPYSGQAPTGVPRYFTTAAVRAIPAGTVALVYPWSNASEAQPELWQAEAGMRYSMPGGYYLVPAPGGHGSATSTTTAVGQALTAVLDGPAPARTPALRAALRAELRAWKVRSVVAQPVGDDPVGFLTWLIGRPPDRQVGAMVAWYHLVW